MLTRQRTVLILQERQNKKKEKHFKQFRNIRDRFRSASDSLLAKEINGSSHPIDQFRANRYQRTASRISLTDKQRLGF